MRLAIAALLCLSVAACATTDGLAAKSTTSGFDGARVVSIPAHGAACTQSVCPGLGANWSSQLPTTAILTVSLFNDISGITGAAVNVNGETVTLKRLGVITNFSRPGDPLRQSRADFAAPLQLVRQIAAADRAWLRVNTTDGYIEAAIVDGQTDSKALHAMRRFLAELDAGQ